MASGPAEGASSAPSGAPPAPGSAPTPKADELRRPSMMQILAEGALAARQKRKGQQKQSGGGSTTRMSHIDRMTTLLEWRQTYALAENYPITISDATIQIKQIKCGEIKGIGTGATVWPAAHVLAKYLEKEHAGTGFWDSKRVIELGCGTGVVGLAAAMLGADVTLTDQAQVLPLLEENVHRVEATTGVSLKHPPTIATYDWGDEKCSHLGRIPFEVVLISDCILPKLYPIAPLVDAIAHLTGCRDPSSTAESLPHAPPQVLVSYEHRVYQDYDPREVFENLLREAGLTKHVIDHSRHDDLYQAPDIEIWEITADKYNANTNPAPAPASTPAFVMPAGKVISVKPSPGNDQVLNVHVLLGGGSTNGNGNLVSFDLHCDTTGNIGLSVWSSAVALCSWHLQRHNGPCRSGAPSLHHGDKILELGAGLGLAACVFALLGYTVVATDKGDVVELLRRNVENFARMVPQCAGSITVVDYDWTQPQPAAVREAMPVDVVVAADCLYSHLSMEPFITCLQTNVTPKRTRVWIANEQRTLFDTFMSRAKHSFQFSNHRMEQVTLQRLDRDIVLVDALAVAEAASEGRHIQWESARGQCEGPLDFVDALLSGWAPDGGMLWPTNVPILNMDQIMSWKGLTYPQVCVKVLREWIPEQTLSTPVIADIIQRAFANFGDERVVTMATLEADAIADAPVSILELWHGPTLAFKDLGMCVLTQLLRHFLAERGQSMTLIVGTSGDTGPSALEACRGAENLSCIVLYPNGNVSSVQEWQMLRCHAECNNAHVVVVDGSSDDLDVPCEAALRDQELKAVHNLGTVNSVNIVRLIMQTCHFFHAYLSLPTTPPQLDVCIPSGAAGHLTACVLAKTMGLPLRHIVVATNQNDVLSIMVNEGVLARKERVVATNSNAMDIQVPYNFERLLFLLTEGDAEAVRTWVQMVHRGERVELPETVRNGFRDLGLKAVSIGQGAAEFEVLHTIRHVYGAVGYVLDPHTAVGVAAVRKLRSSGVLGERGGSEVPMVCMGCAHPAKFPETVAGALGLDVAEARALLRSQYKDHRHVTEALRAHAGGASSGASTTSSAAALKPRAMATKTEAAGLEMHEEKGVTYFSKERQSGWSADLVRLVQHITEGRG